MNPKEKKEKKGSRVQKDRHCLLPKLLVRSVHASPKSPRRLWKAIRTKCMTMVLLTDGSKRRHEAVESNSDAESASSVIGSFSFIPDTGDSPPLFPAVQSGLPATHKWAENWIDATIDYMKKSISMCHSRHGFKDTYHWSCTLLKMGRFAEKAHHLP